MTSFRRITMLAALIACAMAGCATISDIPSFRDPAFLSVKYLRLAVLVDTADLMWRKNLESTMVAKLAERGITALESTALFPPTRIWSEAERSAAFVAAGIDGILSFQLNASGTWEWYVPSATTTTIESTPQKGSDGKSHVKEETTVTTTGGYSGQSDWARFGIRIIDIASGKNAWVAMNRISGGYNQLDRFCEEVAKRIVKDGLAAPR